MFRNVFAFVVVASALALTGCSKCSEQPAAVAPVETPATAPVDGAAVPAEATPMDAPVDPAASPAAEVAPGAAPAATPMAH